MLIFRIDCVWSSRDFRMGRIERSSIWDSGDVTEKVLLGGG